MLFSTLFLHLYTKILEDDWIRSDISEDDVQKAIANMHDTYTNKPKSLSQQKPVVDYNKIECRCAYLYKYAPMHTALVFEAMSYALTENPHNFRMFQDLVYQERPFKICSLGSGPGTDIIGVLAALYDKFSLFPCSAKLVDAMPEWQGTFSSLVSELRLEPHTYDVLSTSVRQGYFNWSFIGADLQEELREDLKSAIKAANLITLVKFVSAATCSKTFEMIEKIFRTLKYGAMVLFIDNAAGGFQELITSAARKHHLVPMFGPLNHQPYINETFNQQKFGYNSCYKTRVAVQLLIKVNSIQFSTGMNLYLQQYPTRMNYSQGYLSPRRFSAQNIRMQDRQNTFIGDPFDRNNIDTRYRDAFRNRNFNHTGFNMVPHNYFPSFTK